MLNPISWEAKVNVSRNDGWVWVAEWQSNTLKLVELGRLHYQN